MQSKQTVASLSGWIWKNKHSRILLVISIIATIIQFVLFKIMYPFPNFLPDSYSYIIAAATNQDINLWPVGYSKFLRFFSSFTHSHIALVLFQYLVLQAAILYLIFTVINLFQPLKWIVHVLFLFGVMNPLWLYVSNFVSSDALFASLSIVWFTQLLWLGRNVTGWLLFWHALTLMLVFSLRFNALYYPLISIAFITVAKFSMRLKFLGIALIITLMGLYILHNYTQYKKLTNTKQFAAFGGWQLAANALYAYAHVTKEDRQPVPDPFRSLHTLVNKHIDSLSNLPFRPDSALGVYYLWDEAAPLKKHMANQYTKDTVTDGLKRWSSMGPIYMKYGIYLIKQYPLAYIKHFLLPNAKNYYAPNTEFLGIYNMGVDTVQRLAKDWFLMKSTHVKTYYPDKKIITTEIFTPILPIINILFFLGFLSYVCLGGFRKSSEYFGRTLRWVMSIWLLNIAFSVMASPIVLRYQVFPMVITSVFMMMLIEFLANESKVSRPSNEAYQSVPQLT